MASRRVLTMAVTGLLAGATVGVLPVPAASPAVAAPPASEWSVEPVDSPGPGTGTPITQLRASRDCGDLEHVIRLVPTGEPLASTGEIDAVIDLAGAIDQDPSEATSIVSVCRLQSGEPTRDFSPLCAVVESDASGITSVDVASCSSIGAAWEPTLEDDGTVVVESRCGSGQVMLQTVGGDLTILEPVGQPGDAVVSFSASAFSLGCDGGNDPVYGPTCFVVDRVEPERGVVEGDCVEASLYPVATGDVRLFVPVIGPLGELAVSGWCWSDSRPTARIGEFDLDASGGGVLVSDLAGDSFTVLRTSIRCVADGTTDLRSGPERCYEAVIGPPAGRAEVIAELRPSICGTPATPTERITLVTSGDRYLVDADCSGSDPTASRVDALGRIQSPIAVDGEAIAIDRVESIVARCGADGPLNCYATAFGATLGNGERVVAHRACGFAELRLPDTGSGSLVAALLAASSIVVGVGLRLAARRRTYSP